MPAKTKQQSSTVKTSRNGTKTVVDLPAGSAAGIPEARVIDTPVMPPVNVENLQPAEQATKTVTIDPNRRLTEMEMVDVLASLGVLNKFFEPEATNLKSAMMKAGAKYAEGDWAAARLNQSNPTETIDPLAFLKMCRSAKLSDEQIAEMISISKTKATLHITQTELATAIVFGEAKSPTMVIDVVKGRPSPEMDEALDTLFKTFKRVRRERAKEAALSTK